MHFRLSFFLLALAGAGAAGPAAADSATPPELVDALNGVFGRHAARAVHAKGVILEGKFTPAPGAAAISKAPHLQRESVPVTVRFSDFAGIPTVPDNDPHAGPRGMAIKFQLPDGSETNLVTHSFNGFPSPTATDFRDLLVALAASGANAPKPTPLETYFANHPVAKAFLTAPKPNPVSFATLPYFGVNTFKFTNAAGKVTFARYQVIPVTGAQYLSDVAAAKEPPDYLVNEIAARLKQAPATLRLILQLAGPGDKLDDPSIAWPQSRPTIELGSITLTRALDPDPAVDKKLMFIPNALPAGIEPADPMIDFRSRAYPVSFSRRQ